MKSFITLHTFSQQVYNIGPTSRVHVKQLLQVDGATNLKTEQFFTHFKNFLDLNF